MKKLRLAVGANCQIGGANKHTPDINFTMWANVYWLRRFDNSPLHAFQTAFINFDAFALYQTKYQYLLPIFALLCIK